MEVWKEKWNYAPIFIGEVSAQTKFDFSLPQIAELYKVSSLVCNNFEKNVIAKILDISKNIFKINSLKPIKVHKKQIIILDRDVMVDKIVDSNKENGKCSNGYIYVCRNNNKSVFISDLSHELAHLHSFYSLGIIEQGESRCIETIRLGYSLKKSDVNYLYDGLNEAVTDLWSKVILRELFRAYPEILTENEKKKALKYYAYPYHVTLLEEIIFNMTRGNVLVWPLFKSYFDGSSCFLDLLEKELLLSLEPIKKMTNQKESALKTAEMIGGSSLLQKVVNI